MKRAPRTFGVPRDVVRGRELAFVAVFTAAFGLVGALAVALVSRGGGATSRYEPSLPHARANVACASCHGGTTANVAADRGVPSAACLACHGPHPSTRGPHRRLQEAGEMRCGTCHSVHAEEGVIFPVTGAPVRFRGAASATLAAVPFRPAVRTVVPLVPRRACAGCHQPGRADDPARRCFPPSGSAEATDEAAFDSCFDEHRSALAEARGGGVCSAQHEAARAFAWEAAHDVGQSSARPRPTAGLWGTLFLALFGACGGGLGAFLARRRAKAGPSLRGGPGQAPTASALPALAPARRVRLPRIDESRCLGCFACVDACPYDVLAVENYVAKVVREDACCGAVLCQQRCPNGSLVIAEGDILPDLPPVTDALESELVPGVFLAGDVTGGSLIKNAIRQGTAVIDAPGSYGGPHPLDVVVIGAGPAGIAAALRAKERGLRCVVVEQGSVAESIRTFPRGKLVYDQPLDLPVAGKLWLEESTKEELLAQWVRVVRKERLDIQEGRRVVALRQIKGGLEVDTVQTDGSGSGETETLRASRVVLAVGRRGQPRKLPFAISEEAGSRVYYHLADARSFEGKAVIVVGLGDVAMEAALALAGQGGTAVTLVHRGSDFSRGSARNVAAVKTRAAAAGLSLRLDTEVAAVGDGSVTLRTGGKNETISADAVFVFIGTEAPRALLSRLGVILGDRSAGRSV